MDQDSLPIEEVLDLLATDAWRVIGLPTMRGRGLYLVHHGGQFVWFSLDARGASASRYQAMNRAQARAFLGKYASGSDYPRALIKPWTDAASPRPATLRAALGRVQELLTRLRADPRACARVMTRWWMWRSPWFGWVACVVPEDRAPSSFTLDDSRAGSELLSMVLADPELDLEAPPPPVAAVIDDLRRRAAAIFEAHGPARDRLLWIASSGAERRGLLLGSRGQFVELRFEGEGEGEGEGTLVSYRKTPDDRAHERLFTAFTRGELDAGSRTLDARLAEMVARAEDPAALEAWLARREIVVRCGEHRTVSWVTDTPTTMLDTYKGQQVPFRVGLTPFLGDEGWYEVRFERFVPLPELARAHDDPNALSVRYTVPKAWAYRFSRERLFETALVAVLRAATGREGPFARTETRSREDPDGRREPSRHVTIGDETVGLTLDLDPMESGHGVHGERVWVQFRGLPPELEITARGQLDMRSGGQLHLDFEARPDLARRLKRACLEALP